MHQMVHPGVLGAPLGAYVRIQGAAVQPLHYGIVPPTAPHPRSELAQAHALQHSIFAKLVLRPLTLY